MQKQHRRSFICMRTNSVWLFVLGLVLVGCDKPVEKADNLTPQPTTSTDKSAKTNTGPVDAEPDVSATVNSSSKGDTPDAKGEAPEGMVWIPGGEYTRGSTDSMANPVEQPTHQVRIDGFWMDETEVTNAQFRKFVEETGYETVAERAPTKEEIMKQLPPGSPEPPAEMLVAASMVFSPPDQAVPLDRYDLWWAWVAGANWQHPEGPDSDLTGRDDHPVVHVCFDDAIAYTKWANKRLPTEAEWEFAARGGLASKQFVWGDAPLSETNPQANIWQGEFPYLNSKVDGFVRTAPVKSFPANGFGLYELSGNVWEWCSDWYRPDTYARCKLLGDVVDNPQGPDKSYDPSEPYAPKRVLRGGSFLCSDSYCSAYRPSARRGQSTDTGMSHLGFRCVVSPRKSESFGPQAATDGK